MSHWEGRDRSGVVSVFACWVAVVVACAPGARLYAKEVAAMDKLSIPPFFVGLSDNTRPVELEIAGHKMTIPRNYIGSAWFSDGQLAFQLFTMYPDFQGVSRESFQTIRFAVGAKTPDVVQITRYLSFDAQRSFRTSMSKAAREFGIETDIEGLVMVREGFDNWQALTNNGYEYYVHKEKNEFDDLIIHCTSSGGNLHNCMVDVKFFDEVVFEYEFFFSHLKDWRDIHQKIIGMLRSFVRN